MDPPATDTRERDAVLSYALIAIAAVTVVSGLIAVSSAGDELSAVLLLGLALMFWILPWSGAAVVVLLLARKGPSRIPWLAVAAWVVVLIVWGFAAYWSSTLPDTGSL